MIHFITYRLNFYRFKWWRRLNGIPDPKPLTALEKALWADAMSAYTQLADNLNRDYEKEWAAVKPGQSINVRRPARYKPPHKDRYL